MKSNYAELLYEFDTRETEHLLLRPFTKADEKDVFEYGSDPQTLKYLIWNGFQTPEDVKSAMVYYHSRPGIYAIEEIESHKCIGCIDLRIAPEDDKASFGYVLNRHYWGKGYMTQALDTLIKLCFEVLDLNRVESTHYVGNEGSGRVMQKCGMILEGVGKQEVKVKGVYHDVVHYAITRDMLLP